MIATNHKEMAVDFLKLSSKGESRNAFSKYVGEGFRHHNAFFKGDADSLMIAMEENAKKTPDKVFEIKHALQDGNFVAVHSHVKQNPQDPGAAVVHIFRFSSDKIIELWDLGQPVPKEQVNENGMF
jgi:predicted SnoaL-like aldol condensation-catalyzing enzyme